MTNSEQFTPSVDLTIFPRINYLKNFLQRANLRAQNGRIYNWAYVPFIDDTRYFKPADGSDCLSTLEPFPIDLGSDVTAVPTGLYDLREDCGSPTTYNLNPLSGTGGGGGPFGDAALDLRLATSLSLTDAVSGNNLVTFSRASTGTYVGSDGLIKSATTDAPRFDHDPVTLQSLGLLIEDSSTNQFTHSDFGDNIWAPINITKKSTNNPAPDGSNTAVLIGDAAGPSASSYLTESLNLVGGGIQTFTSYAKGTTTGQSVFIDYYDGGTNRARAAISLDDGTVSYHVAATGDAVITSTDAGNGWWHCQLTLTPAGINSYKWRIGNYASGDIYIWGAQLEAAAFPSSYIPTAGSAVTRAADVVSIEGTNFSSWYNQGEGTVFVEAEAPGNSVISGFESGLSTERWRVGYGNNNNSAMTVIDGGVTQTSRHSPNNSTPFDQFHKLAGAIAVNNLSFAYNGTVTLDSTLSVPVVNYLNLGKSLGSGGYLNGHITRLAYFPTRKTDEDLIELTT